ncbi:MAG: hypothetical protein GY820_02355 [Gammaproteobacteria bacterium]|nr:hypothetical protein [Gammaproteobacteria bacterium]
MENAKKIKESTTRSKAELLSEVRVEKYRKTRYWAVWLGEELLAVTVYKKGATAVKNILCCENICDT